MERYDKIEYIKDNLKYLNRNDLIDIRDIILEKNFDSMTTTSGGLRINLVILSDDVIDVLYKFTKINSTL